MTKIQCIAQQKVKFQSLAFGAESNYARYHPNFAVDENRQFFDSYEAADGVHGNISLTMVKDINVDYDGSWCASRDSDQNFLLNFCATGMITSTAQRINQFPHFQSLKEEIPENCVLGLGPGLYNLHHFFWELVPVLMRFHENLPRDAPLMVCSTDVSFNQYLNPLLQALGIRRQTRTFSPKTSFRLRQAHILQSLPWRIYDLEYSQLAVERICWKLQGEVRQSQRNQFSSVVYLSRGDNERNRRKIINEREVVNTLRSSFPDLKVIIPPLYEFSHVVRELAGTRLVVGHHGGALNHFLWAGVGVHVHEIVPALYPGMTDYEEITKLMGLGYSRSPSTPVSPRDRSWSNDDQVVDVSALMTALKT